MVKELSCDQLADAIANPGTTDPAEAFAELQRRNERRIRAFVSTRLYNRDEAEDVCQDVWMTVWNKLPTHFHEGRVLAWIFQIASNRCKDHNKKKRPELFAEGELPTDTSWEQGDLTQIEIIRRENQRRLEHCITKLDDRQRCVVMQTLAGCKTAEVATHCGMAPNQVSKAKASARKSLQLCLGEPKP